MCVQGTEWMNWCLLACICLAITLMLLVKDVFGRIYFILLYIIVLYFIVFMRGYVCSRYGVDELVSAGLYLSGHTAHAAGQRHLWPQ
jgi:hypothetical protein